MSESTTATASVDAVRPELSVVLATPYDFESLRPVIGHLRAQTIRDRIEIVIVGSTPDQFQIDVSALDGFAGHRLLYVGPIRSLNIPRAAGFRAAQAPLVALTEDHCFPAPGWAEALVHAHRGSWAAVGPNIAVANPQRHMAWANHLIQYGPWAHTTPSGVQDDLPGHNSCYKRDVLLEFDQDLETLFIAEARLFADLRRRGHQLYTEANAVSYHVYITKLRPYWQENYHIGRQFASNRSRGWSLGHRICRAVASPLVPALRTWRIARRMRELGWFSDLVPRVLPTLWIGLSASALGEMAGYLFGMGHSAAMTLDLDFCRFRFVSDDERRTIWSGETVAFQPNRPRPTGC